MKLFETIETLGHEQVVTCYDKASGYKGIIAIHDTTLGPALGGTVVADGAALELQTGALVTGAEALTISGTGIGGTGVLRSFGASSPSGRFLGYRHTVDGNFITSATPKPAAATQISTVNSATLPWNALGNLAQAALRSPTVFNFYHSDYVLPGPLASAGLVAPEFEITDDNYAITVPNYLRGFVAVYKANLRASYRPAPLPKGVRVLLLRSAQVQGMGSAAPRLGCGYATTDAGHKLNSVQLVALRHRFR